MCQYADGKMTKNMQHFELVETITKDKLIHQGIFFRPQRQTKKAFLWVHGLGGKFYSHVKLWEALAQDAEKTGIGFAIFNNRGHDLIAGIRKVDKRKRTGYSHIVAGTGYEDFNKSMFDIDAGISFLVTQGFSEIILIGHSTGANKVCYYAGSRKDPRVSAIVLASPVSDRYDPTIKPAEMRERLAKMQQLIKNKKGDELQLGLHFFPITPKRFVSLFTPNSLEDQFDYGEAKPQLTHFKRIKKPLLVILGSADEYLDRPAEVIMHVYTTHTRSKNYQAMLLPNVLHSFTDSETKVASTIINWIAKLP